MEIVQTVDTTIPYDLITLVVMIIGFISSISVFIYRMKRVETQTEKNTSTLCELGLDVNTIKTKCAEYDEEVEEYRITAKQVIRNTSAIKSAHKRIDRIEQKL